MSRRSLRSIVIVGFTTVLALAAVPGTAQAAVDVSIPDFTLTLALPSTSEVGVVCIQELNFYDRVTTGPAPLGSTLEKADLEVTNTCATQTTVFSEVMDTSPGLPTISKRGYIEGTRRVRSIVSQTASVRPASLVTIRHRVVTYTPYTNIMCVQRTYAVAANYVSAEATPIECPEIHQVAS